MVIVTHTTDPPSKAAVEHPASAPSERNTVRDQHRQPWGLTRVAPFPPVVGVPNRTYRVELDPDTQTGIYRDTVNGDVIEAGKHGTNKQTSKSTATTGQDGANPTSDSDSVTDYDND
ncbi:putative ATP-grasp-modified RiPP [Sphaerisporangium viridialbum]|uniref:putative ATP-grasp-modified RiPP n=1 Tax=Sphaerisporangium viridialbum TaxID=46189 RepID=UPI003C76AD99